jgi:GNAT superfamily N-acetyltransferase
MTVVIEPVRRTDAAALDGLMARCSAETRYRRFFAPLRTLPAEYRAGALAGDPARHDALATHLTGTPGAGRIVALASLVTSAGPAAEAHRAVEPSGRRSAVEVAELGIMVEDGWQRRGLGTALVAELVERARRRRVPYLRATVQPRAGHLLVWLGRRLPLERSAFAADGLTALYRLG